MAIVGAFAHIEPEANDTLESDLAALDGVSAFALDDPGKIGLLIEAESLDAAHRTVQRTIRNVEGVLGVFPVYANAETDL